MTKSMHGFLRLSPAQLLSLSFLLLVITGAVLLSLPIASEGARLSWIDALFMAASSVTVTGLSVVDTGTQLTPFGQIVLLVLFECGGLGFVGIVASITMLLHKPITLKERMLMQNSMNQYQLQGIVHLIRRVLLYSLIIQTTGAVILAGRFRLEMDMGKALYYGLFHSTSIFTNAGFDLFGELDGPFSGLTRYAEDPIINITVIVLIFLGGIGFIVISDVVEFPRRRQLHLHSKVVLFTNAILIILGALLFFWLELHHTLKPLHTGGKVMGSILQSITPRSGGIVTIEVNSLRQATQLLMILLMFIGAAPGSTGGGIKVTTLAVLAAAVITQFRGKNDVVLFRRRIPADLVFKAFCITFISLLLVISSSLLLSVTEKAKFLDIIFETTSALGTAGISTGLTPNLTTTGKVLIIILMFTGRVGPLTLAYAIRPKECKEKCGYPEGRITIG
jgi:trk system potassium uptake protein